jgi:hypothetical protein
MYCDSIKKKEMQFKKHNIPVYLLINPPNHSICKSYSDDCMRCLRHSVYLFAHEKKRLPRAKDKHQLKKPNIYKLRTNRRKLSRKKKHLSDKKVKGKAIPVTGRRVPIAL